jgi:hypothetical protein
VLWGRLSKSDSCPENGFKVFPKRKGVRAGGSIGRARMRSNGGTSRPPLGVSIGCFCFLRKGRKVKKVCVFSARHTDRKSVKLLDSRVSGCFVERHYDKRSFVVVTLCFRFTPIFRGRTVSRRETYKCASLQKERNRKARQ